MNDLINNGIPLLKKKKEIYLIILITFICAGRFVYLILLERDLKELCIKNPNQIMEYCKTAMLFEYKN